MNRLFLTIISIFICFFGITQLSGKVISVADGDTFTILNNENKQVKIRLHGIDAPELKQDFGQVSKKFLSDQVFASIVWIKSNGQDKYGRTIGIIYKIPEMTGISINELSLQQGMSWHYKKYDQNKEWALLEEKARDEIKGLWLFDNPIPPWSWRKL
jgi:micrococcal nuclease